MSGLSDHGRPARQLCAGSNIQLMQDAADIVECPSCLKPFSSFETVRNRAQKCPVVPSHLPHPAGLMKVEGLKAKRREAYGTPRPF